MKPNQPFQIGLPGTPGSGIDALVAAAIENLGDSGESIVPDGTVGDVSVPSNNGGDPLNFHLMSQGDFARASADPSKLFANCGEVFTTPNNVINGIGEAYEQYKALTTDEDRADWFGGEGSLEWVAEDPSGVEVIGTFAVAAIQG